MSEERGMVGGGVDLSTPGGQHESISSLNYCHP